MFQGKKYVYEVYRQKSFSKAAKKLYISQPSLSSMIKKIEAQVGSPIFDRSTNPITLTPCGKEYIRCAEQIRNIERNFEYYLSQMNELKTGELIIGASNQFVSYILPPVIAMFRNRYPMVKVSIKEGDTVSLEKELFSGVLDLIIDNYAFDESIYEKHFYYREHLLLAVPKEFPSNAAVRSYQLSPEQIQNKSFLHDSVAAVPLSLFRDEPFILLRSGNDTRQRAVQLCHHAGFSPKIILKLDQLMTAYHIACYGMGITFVNDRIICSTGPNPNVIYYKLAGKEAVRDVFFYQKKNRYMTKAMEEFLRMSYFFYQDET